ncbi:heavy metal-associated isoprenylated plant protein 7-like [Silene latifolia]|uniref:heavy metal-associated isoprenylated plant protein 7-like n=1 Tax=Silene latifolia TaxID=37657 RepID=UPI003D77C73B
MGEEKKAEGENKAEEKKPAEEKKEEKETSEEKPKGGEEKKTEDGDEKKDEKDSKEEQPPPPPPEIVLRVFMHCEGCARKVRRCLKSFDGVEDVTTDCKTQKVVVKGEKADPLKILDRVQKKTHRQVELLSPIPKPPTEEELKKLDEKDPPKPEEKKEEPKVITVVLKVHMHCEACSLEIKRRIERMKEVEEALPDLKTSQVTVKGTFEPPKLVEYVYKRTGKRATIVNQDPPPEKKEDDKGKDEKEDKGGDGGEEGKKNEGKGDDNDGDKPGEAGGGGGDEKPADGGGDAAFEEGAKMEFRRNEFQYYPPRYAMEMHAYPPQIFSDENPNACSVM